MLPASDSMDKARAVPAAAFSAAAAFIESKMHQYAMAFDSATIEHSYLKAPCRAESTDSSSSRSSCSSCSSCCCCGCYGSCCCCCSLPLTGQRRELSRVVGLGPPVVPCPFDHNLPRLSPQNMYGFRATTSPPRGPTAARSATASRSTRAVHLLFLRRLPRGLTTSCVLLRCV